MTSACRECFEPGDVLEPAFRWALCPIHARELATDPDVEYQAAVEEEAIREGEWDELCDLIDRTFEVRL